MPKILMEESGSLSLELVYEKEFHYQKFRYETEKRTGKKQHQKPMMSIKVNGLPDIIRKICVYIFCVSSNEPYCVHPNKLVGKDCSNGFYHTTDVKMKKNDGEVLLEIPYLYICRTKKNAVKNSLQKMLDKLPPSVQGKEQMNTCKPNDDNVKTDSIRLKVMLEIDGREYNTLTSIITHHDSGEKVKLNMFELSRDTFTSEDPKSNYIWIFTEDSIGPDIKAGDFEVQIITKNWTSEPYVLQNGDILYKRAIKFVVPECKDNCIQTGDVKAKIVLRCRINDITCEQDIVYIQSKLNRKRKALNERPNDIKRLRLDIRGQSPTAKSQDIGMRSMMPIAIPESFNSNRETATSDSTYSLLQNNSGKTFVQVAEPFTFVPAPQIPAPQKPAPQRPALDNVPRTVVSQQSTSDCVTQASAADSLSDSGKVSGVEQEMDSDSSYLYLSNNIYTPNNSLPEPQATDSILTQNGSSYEEFNQFGSSSSQADPSIASTSYQPSNNTYTVGKSQPVPQGSQGTDSILTRNVSSYEEFNQVGSCSSQADPSIASTSYLPSNNTYTVGKSQPVPQGSQGTDSILTRNVSSYEEFNQVGSCSSQADPSIASTSYQPSNNTHTVGKSQPVSQGSQGTDSILTRNVSSYEEFNQVGSSSSQADPNNESTSYQPYLSNDTYTAGKSQPVPQGSQATDSDGHVLTELDVSGTSQAISSFGKSGYDSGYADSSIASTSYQPDVEPITPLVSLDIIAKSAQCSGILSAQDINNVEGQSSQKEVQIQPVSNEMTKSGSVSGSSLPSFDLPLPLHSVNFDSLGPFTMDSVDLMKFSEGLIKYADCDFQGGPSKPDQLKK